MSHQKMDQLVGFLLHPPLSEIAKKLGKMLKYTPTFKVLSAPLRIYHTHNTSTATIYHTHNTSTARIYHTHNTSTSRIYHTHNTSTARIYHTQNTSTARIYHTQNTSTARIYHTQNTSTARIYHTQNFWLRLLLMKQFKIKNTKNRATKIHYNGTLSDPRTKI